MESRRVMRVSDTQSKGCSHTTASWEASEEGGRQRILVSGADMKGSPAREDCVPKFTCLWC